MRTVSSSLVRRESSVGLAVQPNCFVASPAPLKLASFISEYFRERITPSAPPRKAASTASLVPCGVHLLCFASVGMSISIPGQISVFEPFAPSTQRFVSRTNLANLSILPTCGTKFFRYAGDWKKIYSEDFTASEKEKIVSSLKKAVEQAGFQAKKVWGEVIEDRGSQITFSALGQQAPLEEKIKWDSDYAKRKKIKAILDTLIPEFSVRMGGATSIDVTKPGIDKAYGVRKLRDVLGISLKEMIFIGDALFAGGNDYPAEQAGVISIPVQGPHETKRVVETIIACLSDHGQEALKL